MEYTELLYGFEKLVKNATERRLQGKQKLDHARLLADQGSRKEAILAYQAILEVLPSNPVAWHELAMLQHALGHSRQAVASLIQSIKLDGTHTQAHFDFARLRSVNAIHSKAARDYVAVMGAIDPEAPAVGSQEPVAILKSAATFCRRSLHCDPDWENYLRLAHIEIAIGLVPEALETLQAALAAGHEKVPIFQGLAILHEALGHTYECCAYQGHAQCFDDKYGRAIENYLKALRIRTDEPAVQANLALSYMRMRRNQEAIDTYRQAIQRFPDDAKLHYSLAELLHDDGQFEASKSVARSASDCFPDNFTLMRLALLSLPIVYETAGDVMRYRRDFTVGLAKFGQELNLECPARARQAAAGIWPNFYLAYQACDDKALQMQYGDLVHRIMCRNYPHWSQAISMPALNPGEKIRVGYVSARLYHHTVAKLFLGWLQKHDKNLLDTYAYHLGAKIDPISHQYKRAAGHFFQLQGDVESICQQIAGDRLHILVYLDIGMDDITTKLASLYLAPVQCVAWGHPVTTGFPTLDYFISSELMEPDNAHQHYSEKLICLPGIGVNVPPPYVERNGKSRADFGLENDACIYLSPQSLFKYLPQYDEIFPRIAKLVPNAKFVFIEAYNSNVTNILKRRLSGEFTQHGLNGNEFLVFLPRQDYRDYLDLNCSADVFLDQPAWSGGMTTLEALGCNLPVVTWPGEFMRSRHASACLQQMELDQTIAPDLNGFVEIAAKLGLDTAWRKKLKREIAARKNLLFNHATCVTVLEDFYSSVVSMQ